MNLLAGMLTRGGFQYIVDDSSLFWISSFGSKYIAHLRPAKLQLGLHTWIVPYDQNQWLHLFESSSNRIWIFGRVRRGVRRYWHFLVNNRDSLPRQTDWEQLCTPFSRHTLLEIITLSYWRNRMAFTRVEVYIDMRGRESLKI